jgi:flagellar basal-body rod protein FlgC
MIGAINTALTGLASASKQLAAGASNIANLQTVGSLEKGKQAPYTPLRTQQTAITDGSGNGQGVTTTFAPRDNPFVPAFDPDSPFADKNGIIGVPNINLAEEAVNLNLAEIQYKANIKTIETASQLSDELFRIFDDKV